MDISDLWVELKKCNWDQLQNIKYHIESLITQKNEVIFLSKLSTYQKHIVEDYKRHYNSLQWNAEHNDKNGAISVFHTYSLFKFYLEGDSVSTKMSDEAFATFYEKFVEWKNNSGQV